MQTLKDSMSQSQCPDNDDHDDSHGLGGMNLLTGVFEFFEIVTLARGPAGDPRMVCH